MSESYQLQHFVRIVSPSQGGQVLVAKDPNKEDQEKCDLQISGWLSGAGRVDLRLGPLSYEEADKIVDDPQACSALAEKMVDKIFEPQSGIVAQLEQGRK